MARGGRRAGAKGGNYPNRSDLRTPPEPTGLPYGDRAKLNAARAAVPMGPPPAAAAPSGGGAGLPPQAAPAGPSPGDLPFLHPTQRPNEPVTAGIPQGPGPGPEVLTMNQGNPNDPLMMAVAALDSLGDTADAATKAVRDAVHTSIANRSVP